MATDPEKGNTTTFGAIIERKAPSPTKSRPPPPPPPRAPLSSSSTLTPDYTGSSSTTIRPHLHLSSASQAVDPPLPSPYSFSDAITPIANADDLEAGLHTPTDPLSQHPLTARDQLSTIPTATLHIPESSPSRNPSSSSTVSNGRSGEKNLADDRVRECTMWPTAEELRAKAKAEKRAKNPLMRLSKRNRVILSIVVALTIVGAAVGIGVGVSRAYHGEVWAGNGKSMPIQPA